MLLKIHHQVVDLDPMLVSFQCISHAVVGCSQKGSSPGLAKTDLASDVAPNVPTFDSSINPVARAQCLMAFTMFLPTPNRTIASSSAKRLFGAPSPYIFMLSNALRNHN